MTASFISAKSHIYIYAISRCFYPKRLTVHSGYTFFFCQYVCSLGIEPTNFCAANAMLYHWATGRDGRTDGRTHTRTHTLTSMSYCVQYLVLVDNSGHDIGSQWVEWDELWNWGQDGCRRPLALSRRNHVLEWTHFYWFCPVSGPLSRDLEMTKMIIFTLQYKKKVRHTCHV